MQSTQHIWSPLTCSCRGVRYMLVFLLLLGAQIASGYEFQVEGRIATARFDLHRQFRVFVRDCAWIIQTALTNKPIEQSDFYWETASTNNSEIYKVIRHSGAPATAVIESNSVPTDCADGVTPYIWLIFASVCHLRSITNQMLTPVYDVSAGTLFNKDLRVKAIRKISDNPPNLPSYVAFFSDGNLRLGYGSTSTLKPYRVPFNTGFTSAVAYVTGTTNIGELRLPTGLAIDVLEPRSGAYLRIDLALKDQIVAIVTSWSATCSLKDLMPSAKNHVVVQDRRLLHADPACPRITYDIRDEKWTSVQQARMIYQKQLQQAR